MDACFAHPTGWVSFLNPVFYEDPHVNPQGVGFFAGSIRAVSMH